MHDIEHISYHTYLDFCCEHLMRAQNFSLKSSRAQEGIYKIDKWRDECSLVKNLSILYGNWQLIVFSIHPIGLTHFSPVSHFYTPWKRQKPLVFWRFQGV